MLKIFINFIIISSIFLTVIIANNPVNISLEKLDLIEKKYGPKAKKRVLLWDKMLETAKKENTLNKIKTVNDFFNQIRYKKDIDHWHKNDYWASPFEFLGSGAGGLRGLCHCQVFCIKTAWHPR